MSLPCELAWRLQCGGDALGAMLGFAAAIMFSESLSAVLFGVDPADPLALGGAALFLLGVALSAALIAGRRATQADPMTTLRHE